MLPPWDALAYFQSPVEKSIVATGSTDLLISADPMRIMLAFSVSISAGNAQFTTLSSTPNGRGITLTPQNAYVVLTQADWGPWIAKDWYVVAATNTRVTVFSASLSKWPTGAKRDE